jgi:aryl-alcohol dehydrogenase-like predicted oxidoreductase
MRGLAARARQRVRRHLPVPRRKRRAVRDTGAVGGARGAGSRGQDPPSGDRAGPGRGRARAERASELGARVVEVTYNRLNRTAEDHVLPAAAQLGLGVLARQPLANGYLSGKYRPGSRITSPDDWRSFHDPAEVEAKLHAVAQIEASEVPPDVPLAPWALAWCPKHPAVAAVIPGSKALDHLEANVAAELDFVSEAHPLSEPLKE